MSLADKISSVCAGGKYVCVSGICIQPILYISVANKDCFLVIALQSNRIILQRERGIPKHK